MVRRSQAQADVDVAEGAPAKKRPKIEEEAAREDALGSPQPAPNSFEPRHEYLWWRDGNVIVAADGMSFKLHASILERHSSVFRELLDSAQPRENSPETFERCTVLRVEDKGALLAELLQVLYDGGSGGFFDWKKPIQFADLRRITLLAIKYKVEHIVKEAVARLEYLFPTSFQPDRLEEDSFIGAREGYPVICPDYDDAIGAVTLARAIDNENPPAFIVVALYHCNRFEPRDLFRPEVYDDESVSLSHDDLLACLTAASKLSEASSRVKGPVVDAFEKPRCNSKICRYGMEQLICDWTRCRMFASRDPLSSCTWAFERHAKNHPDKKLCKTCKFDLIKAIDERRRELFKGLGKIFNIPTWPAQA